MKKLLIIFLALIPGLALAQWNDSFATRLNNHLEISGVKCIGGEPSGVSRRLCSRGGWLVKVDNINHCNGDRCTEVDVLPFIAKLRPVNIITIPEIALYTIRPRDRATQKQRMILRKYWVRFNLNAKPVVIEREEI